MIISCKFNVNLFIETSRNMCLQGFGYHGPAKLTHKINHCNEERWLKLHSRQLAQCLLCLLKDFLILILTLVRRVLIWKLLSQNSVSGKSVRPPPFMCDLQICGHLSHIVFHMANKTYINTRVVLLQHL